MAAQLIIFDEHRVNNYRLEIDTSEAVELNLAIKDFSNIAGDKNNSSFFTLNIDIPYTQQNAVSLKHVVNFNHQEADELVGVETEAHIEIGFHTFRGTLKINGAKKSDGFIVIQAQFLGGLKNWLLLVPENLRDLDLGEHRFDEAEILRIVDHLNVDSLPRNTYNGAFDVTYALKFYGKWYDTAKIIPRDMYPDIYLARVVEEIERVTQVPIVSQFFETNYFKHFIYPYVGDGRVIARVHGEEVTTQFTINSASYTKLTFATDFTATLSDTYVRIGAGGNGTLTQNLPGSLSLFEGLSDVILRATIILSSGNGKIKFSDPISGDFEEVDLDFGTNEVELRVRGVGEGRQTQIDLAGNMNIATGSVFNFFIEADIGNPGDDEIYIQNSSIFQNDLKVKDFISGLTDLFNLIWFYDEKNDRLIVEPKWSGDLFNGDRVIGFYRSQTFSDSWENNVDCSDVSLDYKIDDDLDRTVTFGYALDNGDVLYSRDDTFLARVEDMGFKFPEGETDRRNEFFAGTVNRRLVSPYSQGGAFDENFAYVPHLLTYEEGVDQEVNHSFVSRVLWYQGNRTPINDTQYDGAEDQPLIYSWVYATGAVGGTHRTNAPIALCQGYIAFDNALPAIQPFTVNIGYDDFMGQPGIVSSFYEQDLDIYKRGFRGTFNVDLPLNVIVDLERLFRYRKYLNLDPFGGSFFILDTLTISITKEQVSSLKALKLI